jgi:hypothetical protein
MPYHVSHRAVHYQVPDADEHQQGIEVHPGETGRGKEPVSITAAIDTSEDWIEMYRVSTSSMSWWRGGLG